MGKLKKFIMNKMEKVNVQVSMLTCGLIIFSCLVIYLVTSGVMISMLADAYNERANLTFTTIESHFDSRLFIEDVPDGVYGAALSYLSAVKDNMAISEIFVVRKDKNGDFQYILDTKNDKINTVINKRLVYNALCRCRCFLCVVGRLSVFEFLSDNGRRYCEGRCLYRN